MLYWCLRGFEALEATNFASRRLGEARFHCACIQVKQTPRVDFFLVYEGWQSEGVGNSLYKVQPMRDDDFCCLSKDGAGLTSWIRA